jgi:hypothetical protein
MEGKGRTRQTVERADTATVERAMERWLARTA